MNQEIKKNIVSTAFAIGCLILYFAFPIGDFEIEILVGVLVFLLLLPVLYTRFILRERISILGFLPFSIQLRDVFFMVSSVVIGGLFSFFILSLQWGVESYISNLSSAIIQHFGAFAVYELFFVSLGVFLITFFSWGFVYSIKWENPIYTYVAAFIAYGVLLVDFYTSFWVALPFFVPAFFIQKIRDNKNILYMFFVAYSIGLIFDTLIIRSLS